MWNISRLLSNSQCHPCHLISCLAPTSHALSFSFILTTILHPKDKWAPLYRTKPFSRFSSSKIHLFYKIISFSAFFEICPQALSWCFFTSFRSLTSVLLPLITLLLFIVSKYIQAFSITWLPISAGSTFFKAALHTQANRKLILQHHSLFHIFLCGVLRSCQFIRNTRAERLLHFRMSKHKQLNWNKIGELLNHWSGRKFYA